MTRDRARKNAVRTKAAQEGVNYAEARTRLGAETTAHAVPWYTLLEPDDEHDWDIRVSLDYTETRDGRTHTARITDPDLVARAHAGGVPAAELNKAAQSPFPAPAGLIRADMTYEATNLDAEDPVGPVQRQLITQPGGSLGLLHSDGEVVGAWATQDDGSIYAAWRSDDADWRTLRDDPNPQAWLHDVSVQEEIERWMDVNGYSQREPDQSCLVGAIIDGQWVPVHLPNVHSGMSEQDIAAAHKQAQSWLSGIAATGRGIIFAGDLHGEFSSDFGLYVQGENGLWQSCGCGSLVQRDEAVVVAGTLEEDEGGDVQDQFSEADSFSIVYVQPRSI